MRRQRVLGALLLTALLLAPVLASGHHHAATARPTAPCAVCAVTRHTPVVGVVVVSLPSVVPVEVRLEPLATAKLVAPVVRRATSRGPPTHVLSQDT